VEMEHWLARLLESTDGDLSRILRHFGIEPDRFLRDLERALDGYKRGNGGRPALSPAIGGKRSMRVRNSYSRKRRMTSARS